MLQKIIKTQERSQRRYLTQSWKQKITFKCLNLKHFFYVAVIEGFVVRRSQAQFLGKIIYTNFFIQFWISSVQSYWEISGHMNDNNKSTQITQKTTLTNNNCFK